MAERSTLESLRDLDVDDAPSSAGAGKPGGKSGNGDSLLASLLNETSDEANRELQELQERLREKRHAEEEVRRRDEDARRRTLDNLREQEARRREEKQRERDGLPAPVTKAQPVAVFVAAPVAAPAKKSYTTWIVSTVAVLALGGVGAGWYISNENQKQEAIAAKQKADAEATAAAKRAEAAVAAAKAAATPAVAPTPIIVVKAPPIEGYDPEPEIGKFERRQFEAVASIAPEVVAKPSGGHGPKHTGGGGKPDGGARGDGKPRITIAPLNLGGSK
jgi:hypothetical protein